MTGKKFTPPSKTFCVLPWIHLSTRPDGLIRVCCTANASSVGPTNDKKYGGQVGVLKTEDGRPNNLNISDFDSSWNSSYMKNIRNQMLDGEMPASCLKCYKEEAAGLLSKRQWETDYWSDRVDIQKLIDETEWDGSAPANLVYVDLRFGTKCQLACVMCSPHDSASWIKEWQQIFPQVTNESLKNNMQWNNKGSYNGSSYNWHKNNPKFWEQFYKQIPNMQQVYFAGGESLIIEEHYQILEKCIEMGYADKLELRYNSNGIEWREDLFDLWKHFKKVRFQFSIDNIMQRNEYIRYPSNWDHVVKQMHVLDNDTPDNVEVNFACAVQFLNVYYLPDFIKWKLEQNFKKINMWPFTGGGVNFHFVYHPVHLNVKVLPKEFKQKVREKYEHFIPWWEENWKLGVRMEGVTYDDWRNNKYGVNSLYSILSFMEAEDWSVRLPETKQYLSLVDKQRNLNFSDVFPEMSNVFDGIK